VQTQFRTNCNNSTARIINAFSKEILAETPLLALERITQGFQRTFVGTCNHPAVTAIVKQDINCFLKHPFLVSDNYIRRIQINQPFKAVIPVKHSSVKVIEV
jgi:hypothetical protein